MKGETLKTATPMPLTAPMAEFRRPGRRGTPSEMAISGKPCPERRRSRRGHGQSAETTEVTARMVPTERSKPPVSRASIWPMATRLMR